MLCQLLFWPLKPSPGLATNDLKGIVSLDVTLAYNDKFRLADHNGVVHIVIFDFLDV